MRLQPFPHEISCESVGLGKGNARRVALAAQRIARDGVTIRLEKRRPLPPRGEALEPYTPQPPGDRLMLVSDQELRRAAIRLRRGHARQRQLLDDALGPQVRIQRIALQVLVVTWRVREHPRTGAGVGLLEGLTRFAIGSLGPCGACVQSRLAHEYEPQHARQADPDPHRPTLTTCS